MPAALIFAYVLLQPKVWEVTPLATRTGYRPGVPGYSLAITFALLAAVYFALCVPAIAELAVALCRAGQIESTVVVHIVRLLALVALYGIAFSSLSRFT